MIDDDDHGPTTLAIDIGGTNLKAGLLDSKGSMLGGRMKIPTMHPSTPERVVPALVDLATGLGRFDRVSVGFPGRVSQGKVHTAPKLGNEAWLGYDLAGRKTDRRQSTRFRLGEIHCRRRLSGSFSALEDEWPNKGPDPHVGESGWWKKSMPKTSNAARIRRKSCRTRRPV